MTTAIESAKPGFGPVARDALRALWMRSVLSDLLRVSPALLVVGIGSGLLVDSRGRFVAAGGALAITLTMALATSFWRHRSLKRLADRLDRIAQTEDRCATLFEPLVPELRRLISTQLEAQLLRGTAWPMLPWRRALIATALIVCWALIPESDPRPSITKQMTSASTERAAAVRAAANELTRLSPDGEPGEKDQDIKASLQRLARLIESGAVTERVADDLMECVELDLGRRAVELVEAGRSDKRIREALARLASSPGTTRLEGLPGGVASSAEFSSSTETTIPLDLTDERPTGSPLSSTVWEERYDSLVHRYFRDR